MVSLKSTMKEKLLMTSFFVGSMGDIATTAYALNVGLPEKGVMGMRLAEMNNMTGAYIYRIAATVMLIGIYAISKERPGRFTFSADRALRAANLITWGITALNAVQIALYR